MFGILEPCRVLRLGTSSKEYMCKINKKNHDKNKNRKEKNEMNEMEKRTKRKRRKQVRKKVEKEKISCQAEKPTCF